MLSFISDSIKDFTKITEYLCKIIGKKVKFSFNEVCLWATECLKKKLIFAIVIIGPDWAEPYEVLCDAIGATSSVVVGRRITRCYIQHTKLVSYLMEHKKFTVSQLKLLEVVYAYEKFRAYLMSTRVIVCTDHASLRHAKKRCKENIHASGFWFWV